MFVDAGVAVARGGTALNEVSAMSGMSAGSPMKQVFFLAFCSLTGRVLARKGVFWRVFAEMGLLLHSSCAPCASWLLGSAAHADGGGGEGGGGGKLLSCDPSVVQ